MFSLTKLFKISEWAYTRCRNSDCISRTSAGAPWISAGITRLNRREVEPPEIVFPPLQRADHRVPLVEGGRRGCALPDVHT
ncbi:MAG: hypothetical protein PWQ30_1225 [Euryarchaeota archaeon]|nr:hypothetical protein [Euryarchaeota archaeon]